MLFSLGGPDRPESIRPYLFRFFMDPRIIGLPLPLRYLLANLISRRRSRKEAAAAYGQLGGRSPLYENTQAQAAALERCLNAQNPARQYKCFVSMRYWHPRAAWTAREVVAWRPDNIVLLPLYPQFSTTTTGSSFAEWERESRAAALAVPTTAICCYPQQQGFIKASAENIRAAYEETRKTTGTAPRLLFSAHGLPEDIIARGDPYQEQVEQTARAIVETLRIEGLDSALCYQSRVGPKKWIGPPIEEELERAAKDGTGVIVYPLAFVSEHVETLVEIEVEYRHRAAELKLPGFARVPTVSTHPAFIEGLAQVVSARAGKTGIAPPDGQKTCAGKRCVCLKKGAGA